MITKEEVLNRILKFNSPTGRTVKALNKVFSAEYPAGTNLVIEFVKEFKNLPYGDDGKRLDKKADCSQFWINVLYYWFGIDHLGSYTESLYKAKGKQVYKNLADAPVLSVILYKLSSRNPHATHAAGKVSETKIGDTRSKLAPFMIRSSNWKTNKITRIVDFITDEQRQSVTVQAGTPKPLPRVKYTGKPYANVRTGPNSIVYKKIAQIHTGDIALKLGDRHGKWMKVRFEGVDGWTYDDGLFVTVK